MRPEFSFHVITSCGVMKILGIMPPPRPPRPPAPSPAFFFQSKVKYLTEIITKLLHLSLFFQQSCRIETCTFIKKRLQPRFFLVNFVKLLMSPSLQNTCKRRTYLCENIYHLNFFVTVYLTKMTKICLLWVRISQ